MKLIQHIFKLPPNYFSLPFSDQSTEEKQSIVNQLRNYIFLILFALFSHYFKVLTEYGFDRLLIVLSVILPVYYLLTFKLRIPALLIVFVSFLLYAIGPISALFYLAIALVLVLLLRNPKLPLALAALALVITGMLLLRLEVLYFPRLIVGAHFVAAAFMFRGIWFYYESKHGLLKSGFWMDLAYFLIPANICFAFFAIIDPLKFNNSFKGYKTFESGLKRLAYGLSLVLLYRLLANSFPVSFEDVNNFSSLLHYAISKYWLVLNIAGIILCGAATMNLFGFELASLFGNFFLATSFTELWRKVNTNWRDFMIRVFYYPLFFKFKKQNQFIRIYVSIIIAFTLTWLLHDYQLFWISGKPGLKANSFFYWLIYGNLVAFKVYSELKENASSTKNLFIKTIKASGIFILCSFLWLLWESETISDYAFIVKSAFISHNFSFINTSITLVTVISAYFIALNLDKQYEKHRAKIENATVKIIIPVIFSFLLVFKSNYFEKVFPEMQKKLSVLSSVTISEEDNFARDESYYDNILTSAHNDDNPWEIHLKGETKWGSSKGATQRTGDLLMREFIPNTTTDMGYFTLKINSAGFRDDEYTLLKDTNCIRIAIVGGSNECGYGINKEYVFETIAERILDSTYKPKGKRIEILNFASLGSMLIQNIEIVKRKVLPYKPDILVYFSHPKEDKHIARNLSKLILNGVDLKYTILKEAKTNSGSTQNLSRQQIVKRLLPYSRGIMEWGYKELADVCFSNHIKPVWVFIPTPKDDLPRLNYQKFSEMAKQNKFIIFDMSNIYNGYDLRKITASETDLHPGILGHQLITNSFLEEINKHSKELGLE